jgi:type I restriction enzyme, S subunit
MALGLTPYQIIEKGTHPLLVIADEWERIELKNIASVQNGFAFSSKLFSRNEGLPLIRIRDIFSSDTENLYTGEYNGDFIVTKGDILIGMDGDFKVSKWRGNKGLLNQRVCRVHFDSNHYDKEFLFICIQPYLNAIHSETSAVTVKHLSSKTINDIPFPLPPLPEQRAIVSKIEELFSDLDKGIADLKKAQDQLRVYRQAVLKKAFEGELTNTQMTPRTLDSLTSIITKGASPKWQGFDYTTDSDQLLFVTSENVREGYISLEKEKYLPLGFNEVQKRSVLQKGDVLFNIVGASIGRSAIFELDKLSNINQAVALIRLDKGGLNQYVNYFLNSEGAKQEYLKKQVDVARANLSLQNVKDIEIPFCNVDEQRIVIQEIESRLSVCDKVEESISESLEKAKALRQSILKKAFEGTLLSEEELTACKAAKDYEPASVLLEKIKVEKK